MLTYDRYAEPFGEPIDGDTHAMRFPQSSQTSLSQTLPSKAHTRVTEMIRINVHRKY